VFLQFLPSISSEEEGKRKKPRLADQVPLKNGKGRGKWRGKKGERGNDGRRASSRFNFFVRRRKKGSILEICCGRGKGGGRRKKRGEAFQQHYFSILRHDRREGRGGCYHTRLKIEEKGKKKR